MNSRKYIFPSVSVVALTFAMIGCSTPAPTSTTNTSKPANTAVATNTAAKPANTAAANTTSASNTASNTSSAATSSTAGDVIKIDEAGIQVAAPKGFKVQKDGETTNLISPDDAFEVYFHTPKDGDYEKAITEAAEEIGDYVKDVKIVDKGKKVTFGGMEATQFSGTGNDKEEGKPVGWDLIILNAPKKPVVIVSYADEGSGEKYSKEIEEIAGSIKKQ